MRFINDLNAKDVEKLVHICHLKFSGNESLQFDNEGQLITFDQRLSKYRRMNMVQLAISWLIKMRDGMLSNICGTDSSDKGQKSIFSL